MRKVALLRGLRGREGEGVGEHIPRLPVVMPPIPEVGLAREGEAFFEGLKILRKEVARAERDAARFKIAESLKKEHRKQIKKEMKKKMELFEATKRWRELKKSREERAKVRTLSALGMGAEEFDEELGSSRVLPICGPGGMDMQSPINSI